MDAQAGDRRITVVYLPDTHALFWYELGSPELSDAARGAFDQAERGEAQLVLHPIVLAEFYYVLRKAGLETEYSSYVQFVSANPLVRLDQITWSDLQQLSELVDVPEMHDRLIAIAARRLNATLITRDRELQACSQVRWLW